MLDRNVAEQVVRRKRNQKIIVCFSGGHSSALSAVEVVRKYGKDGVVLLNHDISPHVEHEDIKRFKQEVADYLGLPITYANMDGWATTPPLQVAIKNKGFKAFNSPAFCTARLKTEPFHKWLEQNGQKGDWVVYGFDAEETDRMMRRSTIMMAMGYKAVYPLADWERTIYATEEVGIDRPITYQTFKHANCIGCLKAGKQHWYCVYCLRQDVWQEAKEAEEIIGYSIIKGVYLKELENQFADMKNRLGVIPTDKTNAATFWAKVRKALQEDEEQLTIPCDCAF